MKTLLLTLLLLTASFGDNNQVCNDALSSYKDNGSKFGMNSMNRNVVAMRSNLLEVQISVAIIKVYCDDLNTNQGREVTKKMDRQAIQMENILREIEATLEMIRNNKRGK